MPFGILLLIALVIFDITDDYTFIQILSKKSSFGAKSNYSRNKPYMLKMPCPCPDILDNGNRS